MAWHPECRRSPGRRRSSEPRTNARTSTDIDMGRLSRRSLLAWLGSGAAGLAFSGQARAQVAPQAATPLPSFTGPGANPYWNGVNPFVSYPQKLPLLRMTDRGIQLETPRPYFLMPFTPNAAFYVRYHLDLIPKALDLSTWRRSVEGNVERPLHFAFDELVKNFRAVSVAAVNQCSGNSRSRFQPRVPGAQWGNGGMGNARWTGVRLRELLAAARIKSGTVQLQFQGLDRGPGPEGKGADAVMKSLDLTDPALDDALVAYLMNGEPLPMLNGFPIRLVVPGKFGVYWTKHLTRRSGHRHTQDGPHRPRAHAGAVLHRRARREQQAAARVAGAGAGHR